MYYIPTARTALSNDLFEARVVDAEFFLSLLSPKGITDPNSRAEINKKIANTFVFDNFGFVKLETKEDKIAFIEENKDNLSVIIYNTQHFASREFCLVIPTNIVDKIFHDSISNRGSIIFNVEDYVKWISEAKIEAGELEGIIGENVAAQPEENGEPADVPDDAQG